MPWKRSLARLRRGTRKVVASRRQGRAADVRPEDEVRRVQIPVTSAGPARDWLPGIKPARMSAVSFSRRTTSGLVEQLPPRQRDVLIGRKLLSKSLGDLAADMKLTKKAVAGLLARAMQKLCELMAPCEESAHGRNA